MGVIYPARVGRSTGGKGHAFPLPIARDYAAAMIPIVHEYERVVFCARQVWDVFRRQLIVEQSLPPLTWSPRRGQPLFAWIPHTSGIVTWWNHRANREAAGRFLADLLEEVQDVRSLRTQLAV